MLLEIFEKHSAGLLFLSPTGTILLASKAAVRMLLGRTAADSQELSSAALEKKTFVDLLPSSHKAAAEEFLRQIAAQPENAPELVFWTDTEPARCLVAVGVNLADDPAIGAFVVTLRDITQHAVSRATLESQKHFLEAVIAAARDAIVAIDHQGRVTLWSRAAERLFGYAQEEALGRDVHSLLAFPKDFAAYQQAFPRFAKTGKGRAIGRTLELVARRKSGAPVPVELSLAAFRSPEGQWEAVAVIRDISERKRADLLLSRHNQMLGRLYEVSQDLVHERSITAMATDTVRACVEILGADVAWLGEAKEDGSVELLAQWPLDHPYPSLISVRWDETPLGGGPTGRAIRTKEVQVVDDLSTHEATSPWMLYLRQAKLRSSAAIPLVSGTRVFGALNLYSKKRGFFDEANLQNLGMFANLAAAALENARISQELRKQLAFQTALREIDAAILGSLDLRVVLRVLLDEVTTQLSFDAADVFLLDPESQTLELAASRGFISPPKGLHLRLAETDAGRAVLDRMVVAIEDLNSSKAGARAEFFAREHIVSLACAPLISRGQVVGVLEVFARKKKPIDQDLVALLEALAYQAAIAVENARLFANLQKATSEVSSAYDATIEGWSRAMDFRDRETEGHTLRVTGLTVEVARRLGLPEKDIVHVRRGALLHDMGKLAVPDSILLKPGKLTEEEWEVMRQHPSYAYEMLSHIAYLRPALDIPHCHHERWDGTGYPRGLKGEEIPLAARIFAVADVWDALTNDRPYRPAWSQEQALAYIKEQAGRQFDPQVVQAFLKVLEERGHGNSLPGPPTS